MSSGYNNDIVDCAAHESSSPIFILRHLCGRKLRQFDSAIMVAKAAEDWLRCDGTDTLDRAMKRGTLFSDR